MEENDIGISSGENHFDKIKLLNSIANVLASFGVDCGNATLMDFIDMNCGAIPDGAYSSVVDSGAEMQFLSLYTQTAEMRFAFAVTQLLKMSGKFMNPIEKFCFDTGKSLEVGEIASVGEAFSAFDSIVLDGLPGEVTRKIESQSDDAITWRKVCDTHEKAWARAGGDEKIYYVMLRSFVGGILSASKIEFDTDGETFTLKKSAS